MEEIRDEHTMTEEAFLRMLALVEDSDSQIRSRWSAKGMADMVLEGRNFKYYKVWMKRAMEGDSRSMAQEGKVSLLLPVSREEYEEYCQFRSFLWDYYRPAKDGSPHHLHPKTFYLHDLVVTDDQLLGQD